MSAPESERPKNVHDAVMARIASDERLAEAISYGNLPRVSFESVDAVTEAMSTGLRAVDDARGGHPRSFVDSAVTAVRTATKQADDAAAAARASKSRLVIHEEPEEPTDVDFDDPDDPLNDPSFDLDNLSPEELSALLDGYEPESEE